MPQARPLRPITHWRSGSPATFIALMLKTQSLRQFDGGAGAGERKGWLTSRQRPDARDPRPMW